VANSSYNPLIAAVNMTVVPLPPNSFSGALLYAQAIGSTCYQPFTLAVLKEYDMLVSEAIFSAHTLAERDRHRVLGSQRCILPSNQKMYMCHLVPPATSAIHDIGGQS
jgi:hypothetical protein